MPSLIDRGKRWLSRRDPSSWCWAVGTVAEHEDGIYASVYRLDEAVHVDDLELMLLQSIEAGVIRPCHVAIGLRVAIPSAALRLWVVQQSPLTTHPQAVGDLIQVVDLDG